MLSLEHSSLPFLVFDAAMANAFPVPRHPEQRRRYHHDRDGILRWPRRGPVRAHRRLTWSKDVCKESTVIRPRFKDARMTSNPSFQDNIYYGSKVPRRRADLPGGGYHVIKPNPRGVP